MMNKKNKTKEIRNKIKDFIKNKADNIDMKGETIKEAYIYVSQGPSVVYETYIKNEILAQQEKLKSLELQQQEFKTNTLKEQCIEELLVLYDEDKEDNHINDKINLYKKLLEISETEIPQRKPGLKKDYYGKIIKLYDKNNDPTNAAKYQTLLNELTPPKPVKVQPDVSSLPSVSDEDWEMLKTNLSNAHKESPRLITAINDFLDLCMLTDGAKTNAEGQQAIRKRASLVVNYLIALSKSQFKEVGPKLGRAWKHVSSSYATMTALENLEKYIDENPLSSS